MKTILKFGEYSEESLNERILFETEYDNYLKDNEYMKYFNKVKERILELFPTYNTGGIDLLIDKIYGCYAENYSIDDTVNHLYMSGNLFTFYVSSNDI